MKTLSLILFPVLFIFITSCRKQADVMYSEEELKAKIDSLFVSYDQTVRPEYQQNYELRRPVEIRHRVQRVIDERKNRREGKNTFSDTARLREDL